jgi:hypothetical protein
METHLGSFYCGGAHDKSARKQSGQPGCEPNAHTSWVGDGSLLLKRLQCSSNNYLGTIHVLWRHARGCVIEEAGRRRARASRYYVNARSDEFNIYSGFSLRRAANRHQRWPASVWSRFRLHRCLGYGPVRVQKLPCIPKHSLACSIPSDRFVKRV